MLLAIAVTLTVIYFNSRKIYREQKNYERGLKMVPLLIHLPPLSSDIQGGGRDERDVNDETLNVTLKRVQDVDLEPALGSQQYRH